MAKEETYDPEPAGEDVYAKDVTEETIELNQSAGVPGQVQYPEDSSMGQYAAEEEEEE